LKIDDREEAEPWVVWQTEILQGLKPNVDMIGFIGPTKVVPLLQSLWEFPCDGFSAACLAQV
jgi:hypothetical protein